MSWGIYCIETVWDDAASSQSVLPMLELLKSRWGTPFVHRDAVTRDEFFHHINSWKDLDDFPILYLGYHGAKGEIWLDENQQASAGNQILLANLSGELEGRCVDRVVHFGSCSTVDKSDPAVRSFGNLTGVSAISGYSRVVDWMYSLAFELLYFETIQWIKWTNANFRKLNRERMRECRNELNRAAYESLREQLGFNIAVPQGKI